MGSKQLLCSHSEKSKENSLWKVIFFPRMVLTTVSSKHGLNTSEDPSSLGCQTCREVSTQLVNGFFFNLLADYLCFQYAVLPGG